MRFLIVALLAAISYAQTGKGRGKGANSRRPRCEGRSPQMCQGPGSRPNRICMLDRSERPPKCVEGELGELEDLCQSLEQSQCASNKGCCWNTFEMYCTTHEECFPEMPNMMGPSGGAMPNMMGGGPSNGGMSMGGMPMMPNMMDGMSEMPEFEAGEGMPIPGMMPPRGGSVPMPGMMPRPGKVEFEAPEFEMPEGMMPRGMSNSGFDGMPPMMPNGPGGMPMPGSGEFEAPEFEAPEGMMPGMMGGMPPIMPSNQEGVTPSAPADTSSSSNSGAVQGHLLPVMSPNPPLSQRQMTMDCAMLLGEMNCNRGMLASGRLCVWDVREMQCEETSIGWGNLCASVRTENECNGYRDCCWDMEMYCDELDNGDCPNRFSAVDIGVDLPTNGGSRTAYMPGAMTPDMMSIAEEAQEAKAEAAGEAMENMMEMMGGGPMAGPGPMLPNGGGFGPGPVMPIPGSSFGPGPVVPSNSGSNSGTSSSGSSSSGSTSSSSSGSASSSSSSSSGSSSSSSGSTSTSVTIITSDGTTTTNTETVGDAGTSSDTVAYVTIPLVPSCTGLSPCFGRVGQSMCITDPSDNECKQASLMSLSSTHHLTPQTLATHDSSSVKSIVVVCGSLVMGMMVGFLWQQCKTSKEKKDLLLDQF